MAGRTAKWEWMLNRLGRVARWGLFIGSTSFGCAGSDPNGTSSDHKALGIASQAVTSGANTCQTVTCDASGSCVTSNKPDGTGCDDGNLCTQTDSCARGVCTGTNPVSCGIDDQCHGWGSCDPALGQCKYPNLPDNTPCFDANICTSGDTCHSGICAGSPVSTGPFCDGAACRSITQLKGLGLDMCAQLVGGRVDCWGFGTRNTGQNFGTDLTDMLAPTPEPSLTGALDWTNNFWHSCVVQADGLIRCWGQNNNGVLGNGTHDDSPGGTFVHNITNAVKVQAEPYATCAVLADGSVECWGNNNWGQLGDGTTTSRTEPVPVINLGPVIDISVNSTGAFALLADHTVKYWGSVYNGAYAPNAPTPVAVPGFTGATQISLGMNHACAVMSDASVKCVGDNTYGQLGNGTTTPSTVPVTVGKLGPARKVVANYTYSCALLLDGSAWCWGFPGHATLGTGRADLPGVNPSPLKVLGIAGATDIAAGETFDVCVLLNGCSVQCWGGEGGMGIGTAAIQSPRVARSALIPTELNSLSIANGCVLPGGLEALFEAQNSAAVMIDSPVGQYNHFDYPDDQGQPTSFAPGPILAHAPVPVDAAATWTLGTSSAQIDTHSAVCPVSSSGGRAIATLDGLSMVVGSVSLLDVCRIPVGTEGISDSDQALFIYNNDGFGWVDTTIGQDNEFNDPQDRGQPRSFPPGMGAFRIPLGRGGDSWTLGPNSLAASSATPLCGITHLDGGDQVQIGGNSYDVPTGTDGLPPLGAGRPSVVTAKLDWIMAPHFPGTESLRQPTADDASPTCIPETIGTCRIVGSGEQAGCTGTGVHTCLDDGSWSTCLGYEFCNGLDDDCNGRIDDGSVCQTPHSLLASGFQPGYFPGVLTTTLPDLPEQQSGIQDGLCFDRDAFGIPIPRPCSKAPAVPVPGSKEAQPDLSSVPTTDNDCEGTIDAQGICVLGSHPGLPDMSLPRAEWSRPPVWSCFAFKDTVAEMCRTSDGRPGCVYYSNRPPQPPGSTPPATDPNPPACVALGTVNYQYHCDPGKTYLCTAANGKTGVQTCRQDYLYTTCSQRGIPYGWDTELRACGSSSDNAPIDHYQWTVDRHDTVVSFATQSCQADFVFPAEGTYDVTVTAVARDGSTSPPLSRPVRIKNHLIASVGDSVASGEGVPEKPVGENPTPEWLDRRCHRSRLSWHALASRDLETRSLHDSVTFVSLACSGSGTVHLWASQYDGQEPDGTPEQPQLLVLASILRNDPRALDALLMQTGANDFAFAPKLSVCAIPTLTKPDFVHLAVHMKEAYAAAVSSYGILAAILDVIVAGGNPVFLSAYGTAVAVVDAYQDLETMLALHLDSWDVTSCAGNAILDNPTLFPTNPVASFKSTLFPGALLPGTVLFDPNDPEAVFDPYGPFDGKGRYKALNDNMLRILGNKMPPAGRVYIADYFDPTNFAVKLPPQPDDTERLPLGELIDGLRPIVLKGAIADNMVPILPSNSFKGWLGSPAALSIDWDLAWATNILGSDGVVSSSEAKFAHDRIIPQLNQAVELAANHFHWQLVPTINTDDQIGSHGYSAEPGVRGIRNYDESKRLQGGKDGTMHPNVLGHGIYRSQLEPVLVRDLMDGL